MRVLVTGGSGFVGRHVVPRLQERGDDVRVVDLNPYPNEEVSCVVGDLREQKVIEEALSEGFDAVVHLAAITSVLQSVKDPGGVYATNIQATAGLLERSRALGVERFVFASSNAVVGNIGSARINEDSPLRPLTPYGGTKAAGEMLMSYYGASYGMIPVALRFTNIYGAGMQTKDSVVARLMKAALAGGCIEIYGDGEQVRDYLYVTDAVSAIMLGLSLEQPATLTIGAGTSVSLNELFRLTVTATGLPIGATYVAGKPGEMPAVIVDISRARAAGFSPGYTVAEGLAATWTDFSKEN